MKAKLHVHFSSIKVYRDKNFELSCSIQRPNYEKLSTVILLTSYATNGQFRIVVCAVKENDVNENVELLRRKLFGNLV